MFNALKASWQVVNWKAMSMSCCALVEIEELDEKAEQEELPVLLDTAGKHQAYDPQSVLENKDVQISHRPRLLSGIDCRWQWEARILIDVCGVLRWFTDIKASNYKEDSSSQSITKRCNIRKQYITITDVNYKVQDGLLLLFHQAAKDCSCGHRCL